MPNAIKMNPLIAKSIEAVLYDFGFFNCLFIIIDYRQTSNHIYLLTDVLPLHPFVLYPVCCYLLFHIGLQEFQDILFSESSISPRAKTIAWQNS